MTIIAVPNISEGREMDLLQSMSEAIRQNGSRVLDVHSDPHHNRSVFTVAGDGLLVDAMSSLAERASVIDLTVHEGIHPRLGGLDVCPFVPVGSTSMTEAVEAARDSAGLIADRLEIPVYLYGEASERALELPEIRRGGLPELAARMGAELPPDRGPRTIDPRRGVVCVGARGPLIAFNVWLEGNLASARRIAARVRTGGGGLRGVRSLGLSFDESQTQVSMNLIDPATTGIDRAFERVRTLAEGEGTTIVATEIVGLVPERFLPNPDAEAARLLKEPGRSLELALRT